MSKEKNRKVEMQAAERQRLVKALRQFARKNMACAAGRGAAKGHTLGELWADLPFEYRDWVFVRIAQHNRNVGPSKCLACKALKAGIGSHSAWSKIRPLAKQAGLA